MMKINRASETYETPSSIKIHIYESTEKRRKKKGQKEQLKKRMAENFPVDEKHILHFQEA